jgi:tetratricopeptide (TPR) repeat protein
MKKLLALVGLLAALVLSLYVIRSISAPPATVLSAPPKYDHDELERLIGVFEARTEDAPGGSDFAFLGNLYLLRSQWTYDLADLEKARSNFEKAAAIHPDTPVLTGLAQANLALHDFNTAARLAGDVIAVNPSAFGALAIATDAQLALGEYGVAGESIEVLSRQLPGDPAVAIRAAQRNFLIGDGAGAVEQALLAVDQARRAELSGVDQAFYQMVAGRFLFEQGDYEAGRRQLESAHELDPKRPGVLYELGRVAAAQGDLEAAAGHLEAAAQLLPDPTTLALLGDVLTARGDEEGAQVQYDTITAIASLDQTAYRRPIAAAWAGRGFEVERALALATDELAARSDPTTNDVLALALYRAGRLEEAYDAVQLAIGPADARIWYHAGLVAASTGHTQEAIHYLETALALNPRFHPLEADEASRLLDGLRE